MTLSPSIAPHRPNRPNSPRNEDERAGTSILANLSAGVSDEAWDRCANIMQIIELSQTEYIAV